MENYLESLNQNHPDPLMEAIRLQACAQAIPIIKMETLVFIEQMALLSKAERVLEIGAAIGYFAIHMAKYANVRLTSIEIDKTLAEIAKANIAKANQETMIDLLNSDALEIETAGLGIYDIIFVDGAKGKYRAYFNKYKDSLRKGGFYVFDNLLFRGQVAHPETIISRNRRQLVNKIKDFNAFILDQPDFNTRIYPLGDGIAVAIKMR
ncbi:MAG: O-methyltransferase [Candidatus Izemoplasmatales bacterium]|jgi:predicted O-methyltransferase YrrM